MIKDIQNKTGTQIHFKEENVESADRICIIKGGYEAVHLVEEMIKSLIENQPIIETYEMFIPQKACGKIIGKGGEIIQQMQTSSGAKIIIEYTCGSYDSSIFTLYKFVMFYMWFYFFQILIATNILQILREKLL